MAILKMRDADGNIKSIAIMKGDKGDGVPDGGSAGQVVKKTAEGTEWAYPSVTPAVVFSNTDVSVASAAITKRGLYEVEIGYTLDSWDVSHNITNNLIRYKAILSVDDLSKTSVWRYAILTVPSTKDTTDSSFLYALRLTYNNNKLSVQVVYKEGYFHSGLNELEETVATSCILCIAEVKLLIPYAEITCPACINPMGVDAFANHQPIINSNYTGFEWSGNWTIGDMDVNGNYREFNTIHLDTGDGTNRWLVYTADGVDQYPTGFWSWSAGYRFTGGHRIGTAHDYDMVMAWTAPIDGTVKIGATDFEFGNYNSNFNLALYLNNTKIYPSEGCLNVGYGIIDTDEGLLKALGNLVFQVKEGDTLYFRCARTTNAMNDTIYPSVEYVHDCVLADTSL